MLSLLVIAVSFIAYQFFGRSDDRVKLTVFVMIFAAAVGFGTAVLRESQKPPTGSSKPALPPAAPVAIPTSPATVSPLPVASRTPDVAPSPNPAPRVAKTPTPLPSAAASPAVATANKPQQPAPPNGTVRFEYVGITSHAFRLILHNDSNRVAIVKQAYLECPVTAGNGIWVTSPIDVEAAPPISPHQNKLLTLPLGGGVPQAAEGHSNDECKVYMKVYVEDSGLKETYIPVVADDISAAS